MSHATIAKAPEAAAANTAVIRSWAAPVTYLVLGLLALVGFAIGSPNADARFRITDGSQKISVPDLVLGTTFVGWAGAVVMLGIAAYAFVLVRAGRKPARWMMPVFAAAFVISFLVWAIGSADTPNVYLSGLIAGSFTLATPLIFGSLSGVLCERAGVVNIAIEGQLLAGAFCAAIVGSMTGSLFAGVLAAVVGSVLVSMVLAVFAIKYRVNQVIVGVVLNVLVAGLTSFLFSTVMVTDPEKYNAPPAFSVIRIPLLADIPIFGPIFFNQTILGYGMYIAVFVVWFGLFKTRWGLRVRAVGEHPKAADTVGIKVNSLRFWNVVLARRRRRRRRRVLHAGDLLELQQGNDGGAGLHRPGRIDLRPLEPDRSVLRGAALRVLAEPLLRADDPRHPGAEPVHADAAVRRDDLRGGRPGRQVQGARRRRRTVREGVAGPWNRQPSTQPTWETLRVAAVAAMERAYAPYSKFKVGAAALTEDGRSSPAATWRTRPTGSPCAPNAPWSASSSPPAAASCAPSTASTRPAGR